MPHYVSELATSAYADATLRDVLDMQVGVAHSELYSDPATQFWNYARAAGFCRARPTIADPVGCMSTWSDCASKACTLTPSRISRLTRKCCAGRCSG